jgi:hypothetical protein
MRVIAKKRCRAMFEPPEKGERATLNPNLSTRLKPTFFPIRPLGLGLPPWRVQVHRGLPAIRKPFELNEVWRQRRNDVAVSGVAVSG